MKRVLLLLLLTLGFSNIEISGDARLRPRYDIKDSNNGIKTYDLYYMYRGRLNFASNIGDGWFFKTRIGYNGVASISKMGAYQNNGLDIIDIEECLINESDVLDCVFDRPKSASKPYLSFLNLYFGKKLKKYGYWGGAIPIKGNPAMDIHFYPDKIIDIPWTLFNNESINGFSGFYDFGSYKVDAFLVINSNVINKTVNSNSSDKMSDMQTFGINVSNKSKTALLNFRYLKTFGEDNDVKPNTMGFDVSYFPYQTNIFTFSYYVSTSYNVQEYDIIFSRIKAEFPKVGPGSLMMWYDLARKEFAGKNYDDIIFLCTNDCMRYIWLSYNYLLYKSDFGSINIMPTIRIQNGKYNNSLFDNKYSRSKYELTINYKFK